MITNYSEINIILVYIIVRALSDLVSLRIPSDFSSNLFIFFDNDFGWSIEK